MDKLNLETPDLTDENIKRIGELFPQVITEAEDENGELRKAIDFDALKQELSYELVEGNKERYQFTWPGKQEAKLEARRPINKTLRPCREESVDFDTTENLYIEGDNLDALKLIRNTYAGKIRMIYIDPPYNTGNDFIYEDDFSVSPGIYSERSGDYDDEGGRLIANLTSNGRFHSDWCSMIYPRLLVAKDLLCSSGIIFISIDDNELSNATKLCDEVFGKENFIDNIIWKKRYGGGAKERYLVSLHEYVLMYAKNINELSEITVPLTQDSIDRYYTKRDTNFAQRGPYRTHPLEANKTLDARKNLVYPISAPDGSEVWPKRQWLWGRERVADAISNGELEFSKTNAGEWSVQTKQYLKEKDGSMRRGKFFSIIDDVYTQHGTNEMIRIFGSAKCFPYPKPTEFMVRLLSLIDDKNSIILDFFSGSGTLGEAVFKTNQNNDEKKKFILIQIPEPTNHDSDAYKAGFSTIAEIGKERLRRTGAEIKEQAGLLGANLDIGFRVLKVDSSNFHDSYKLPGKYVQSELFEDVDNVDADRTSEDMLFEVLPKLRIPLTASIELEDYCGKQVFNVNSGQLLACFDTEVTVATIEKIAKQKPVYAVLRDASLKDDATAANFEELFKTYSPDTVRNVI